MYNNIYYVCDISLFSYLTYVHFGQFVTGRHIIESVNNTSRVCKRMVQSDTVENNPTSKLHYSVISNFICGFELFTESKTF